LDLIMGERRVRQDAMFYEFSVERHVPVVAPAGTESFSGYLWILRRLRHLIFIGITLNGLSAYAEPVTQNGSHTNDQTSSSANQRPGSDPVVTECRVKDRGYQVQVIVSNSSEVAYHCVSICYYRQNRIAYTGHWQTEAYVVPPRVEDRAVATLKSRHPMTPTRTITTRCSPE
jgi:hypothetical protein